MLWGLVQRGCELRLNKEEESWQSKNHDTFPFPKKKIQSANKAVKDGRGSVCKRDKSDRSQVRPSRHGRRLWWAIFFVFFSFSGSSYSIRRLARKQF